MNPQKAHRCFQAAAEILSHRLPKGCRKSCFRLHIGTRFCILLPVLGNQSSISSRQPSDLASSVVKVRIPAGTPDYYRRTHRDAGRLSLVSGRARGTGPPPDCNVFFQILHCGNPGTAILKKLEEIRSPSQIHRNIAWAVASLLQFCQVTSPMKEAAGVPAVDRGQVPRGGQGIGVFSLT
jgi:hypothetical protein